MEVPTGSVQGQRMIFPVIPQFQPVHLPLPLCGLSVGPFRPCRLVLSALASRARRAPVLLGYCDAPMFSVTRGIMTYAAGQVRGGVYY
jgi:hypothetical protein